MVQDFIVYIIIFLALLKSGMAIWNFFKMKEKTSSKHSGCAHCNSGYTGKFYNLK